MWLATVGDSFTLVVMLTGRGGRFGSMPGLFVGIGFWIAKEILVFLRSMKNYVFGNVGFR